MKKWKSNIMLALMLVLTSAVLYVLHYPFDKNACRANRWYETAR